MKRSLVLSFFTFIFTAIIISGCSTASKETAPVSKKKDRADAIVGKVEKPGKLNIELEDCEGECDYDSASLERAEDVVSEEDSGGSGGYEESKTVGKKRKTRKSKMETEKGYSRPKVSKSSSSGLKAAYSDDNKQFNYFVNFLEEFKSARHFTLNVKERIFLKIQDGNGKSLPGAAVKIYDSGSLIEEGKTFADGSYLFFPSSYNQSKDEFKVSVKYGKMEKEFSVKRDGDRAITVKLDGDRGEFSKVPVDIVFVLDTTGSMGEEINRLKRTIEIINLNITSLSSKPKVRFGMVLYRDRGDAYVTKVIPLTEDLERFRTDLNVVGADGGGDGPEDLQSALQDTVQKIEWSEDGIRLGFVITDAAPHLDYGQQFTYVHSAKNAKKRAIKLFTIGTGGLDINGEYVLRQIAQYTYAKYIFLTYGEKGESAGGAPGAVSHHTGSNFKTDKLEAIVIRIAKEELSHLTDQPLEDGEEFFEATKIENEKNEETLKKLFDMAISQLEDYSSAFIDKGTPAAVMPLSIDKKEYSVTAEFLTEQLTLSFAGSRFFKPVDRKDLQSVLNELAINQSGAVDDKEVVKAGKLLGAKMLITGKLYEESGKYVLFVKLLDSETAAILSMTKIVVDKKLGIPSA